MHTDDAQAYWDREIAALESKLAKARAVRDALADPDLAAQVAKSLGVDVPPAKVSHPSHRDDRKHGVHAIGTIREHQSKSSVFTSLVWHFLENQNEWQTLADLAESKGLNYHTTRQTVYMKHADKFERRPDPSSAKHVTQFRLVPECLNQYAQEKAPKVVAHHQGSNGLN